MLLIVRSHHVRSSYSFFMRVLHRGSSSCASRSVLLVVPSSLCAPHLARSSSCAVLACSPSCALLMLSPRHALFSSCALPIMRFFHHAQFFLYVCFQLFTFPLNRSDIRIATVSAVFFSLLYTSGAVRLRIITSRVQNIFEQ